jgi:predicted RNase H-like HicB family nuclease
MALSIEIEREEFEGAGVGRFIAEIPALPGVMAYGLSESDAVAKTEALALRVIAERLEHGEATPAEFEIRALFRIGNAA